MQNSNAELQNLGKDATTADKTTEKKREQMEIEESKRENFVTSGNLFIQRFAQFVKASGVTKEIGSKYMQKVLHSIFFLGHIYKPAIRPEEYFPEDKVQQMMKKFKEPFEQYLTHLPCQTPYSILLKFVTEVKKPQKLEDLMKELWNINKSLWKMVNMDDGQPTAQPGAEPVANVFTATAVAQSFYKDVESNQIPKSAFGASLSCQGRIQRRIMIYISCLNVWDRVISYAVCQKGKSPAILFPNHVHCKAYKLICENSEPKEFAPCTNCDKSYPNVKFEPSCNTNADVTWPYGNCAENECLSKLLKDCPNLKNNMCTQKDNQGNQMSIKEIEDTFKKKDEDAMKRDLVNLLGSWKFNLKDRKLLMFQPV